MPNGIPRKGEVLTQVSYFWFAQTDSFQPNHLISRPGDPLPANLQSYADKLAHRNMIGGWKMFVKVNDVSCLGSANAWVFCDESMYTLQDGYMQCNLSIPGYPDVPGKYDCGGNCFSFVDGHVEYKKWKYGTSDPKAGILNAPYAFGVRGPGSGMSQTSSGLDPDWKWLREHTSCPP